MQLSSLERVPTPLYWTLLFLPLLSGIFFSVRDQVQLQNLNSQVAKSSRFADTEHPTDTPLAQQPIRPVPYSDTSEIVSDIVNDKSGLKHAIATIPAAVEKLVDEASSAQLGTPVPTGSIPAASQPQPGAQAPVVSPSADSALHSGTLATAASPPQPSTDAPTASPPQPSTDAPTASPSAASAAPPISVSAESEPAGKGRSYTGPQAVVQGDQRGSLGRLSIGHRLRNCPEGCMKSGVCDRQVGVCQCPIWLSGPACETTLMPACEIDEGLFMPLSEQSFKHSAEANSYKHLTRDIPQAAQPPITCDCFRQSLAALHSRNHSKVSCIPFSGRTLGDFLDAPVSAVRSWQRGARQLLKDFEEGVRKELDGQQIGLEGTLQAFSGVEDGPGGLEGSLLQPLSACPNACGRRGWCRWLPRDVRRNATEPVQCFCFQGFVWNHRTQLCEPSNQYCPNSCNHRGECVHGFCHCQQDFWGMDCSLSAAVDGDTAHLFEGRRASVAAGLPDTARGGPRIWVYPLPPQFSTGLDYFHALRSATFFRNPLYLMRDRLLSSR
ncbi:hypothetical protein CYMTET_20234, partial [Cymbomonas tetramitiformis]